MNAVTRSSVAALAFAATLLLPDIAQAGIFRAYLSATGNDANPCTLPQPCRLLPAALAAVNDGGEIWMLDSANYNVAEVAVAKSVTILAVPGEVGSVVSTGAASALAIAAPNVVVTLRNLVIVGVGASGNGVTFTQGAELLVEGCEIANLAGRGVTATNGVRVVIKDTTIRNVGMHGFLAEGAVDASLDRVHVVRSTGTGVVAGVGATVTLSDSVVSGHGTGVQVMSGVMLLTGMVAVGPARLTVQRSVITMNGSSGLNASAFGGGASAEAIVTGNTFTRNGAAVELSSAANITLGTNTFAGNSTAVQFAAGASGSVYSLQNNVSRGNQADVVGGVLTPAGHI